jgi:hypothetical protein
MREHIMRMGIMGYEGTDKGGVSEGNEGTDKVERYRIVEESGNR